MRRVLPVLSAILIVALGLATLAVHRQMALDAAAEARMRQELELQKVRLEQRIRALEEYEPSDASIKSGQVGDFPPWYVQSLQPNGSRPPPVPTGPGRVRPTPWLQ
jgi:hypothetical protein